MYKPALLALFALSSSTACLQAQTLFGKNLVVNGDAESGPGTAGGNSVPSSIPGWTPGGAPNVVLYSAANRLSSNSLGPAVRGSNYFAGTNTAKGTLTQKIDVSAAATQIDAGTVSYDASAYLGGESGDNASLVVTFLGASGNTLTSLTLGPIGDDDRPNDTGIFLRRQIGQMPVGTRAVGVELDLIRTGGINNDGCADNIAFQLNNDATTPSGFFGSNLIANGNGETPNGTQVPVPLTTVLKSGVIDLPNSVRIGAFMVDTYSPDSDLTATTPGPSDRGSWYFYGGSSNASSSATQDIDVGSAAAQIDSGKVTFNFSGWVGGYADQDDNMTVTAQFMSWQGNVLGSARLGPVLSAERNLKSLLVSKSQTGGVPTGTRWVRISMQSVREAEPMTMGWPIVCPWYSPRPAPEASRPRSRRAVWSARRPSEDIPPSHPARGSRSMDQIWPARCASGRAPISPACRPPHRSMELR